MEFSKKEMTAILSVGKAMVDADGKVDDNELTVMSLELVKFGVPRDHLKELFKAAIQMEPSEAMAIISMFNQKQKKYVASYLGTIMAADGNIDDRELALWRIVSKLCGLPNMTITEAIGNMTHS